MTHKILGCLILLGLTFTASGQTFLVLEKMGTKKRHEFQQGEQMEVRLNDDDFYTRINILGLSDSLIITDIQKIPLSSIKEVRLTRKNSFIRYAGPSLITAGVLLFVFDTVNQAVVSGGGYTISPGVATASVALVGLGTIFIFAGRDKIKVKKWWRLRVVDI